MQQEEAAVSDELETTFVQEKEVEEEVEELTVRQKNKDKTLSVVFTSS